MDRRSRQATVHGVTRVGHNIVTKASREIRACLSRGQKPQTQNRSSTITNSRKTFILFYFFWGGGGGCTFWKACVVCQFTKRLETFNPWTILEKWLLSPEQARSRLSNSGWKGPASSPWVLGLACALLASVQWG